MWLVIITVCVIYNERKNEEGEKSKNVESVLQKHKQVVQRKCPTMSVMIHHHTENTLYSQMYSSSSTFKTFIFKVHLFFWKC